MGGCITAMASRDLAAGVQRAKGVLQITENVLQDGVPKPPTSVRSIRLTEELWTALQAQADSLGVSLNRYVTIRLDGALRDQRKAPAAKPKTEQARHRAYYGAGGTLEFSEVNDPTDFTPKGRTTLPPRPTFTATTALGEPIPPRKAFNPQPKKGKK